MKDARNAGSVFVVVAPSGAGKTSLVAKLVEEDADLRLSVSFTTRPAREGEENGREYNFIDRPAFERMIAAGDFLEHANVYGNLYGTSKRWIEQAIAARHDVVLEIDWQGAQQVRKLFPEVVGIFILPPSMEVLEQRLQGRGKDTPESIAKRLASAREEISHVLEFEYIIVNDRFEAAVSDLMSVVRATRLARTRQRVRLEKLLNEFK